MPEPSPPAGPKKPAAPAKKAAAKAAAPAKPGDKGAPAAKDGAAAAAAEPARPPLQAELRARLRRGKPARFEVGAGGVVLGRDDSAAVAIPLEGVSREHARIQWDGKGWWIEDLKSTNGTFLNGDRVARERLQHLDVIGLGRKADLVFILRTPQEAPQVRQGIVRAALVEPDGATHEIATGELTLGRSVACNVVADLSAVSKVHARIERSSDQLLLEDLGSSNGTFVNGSRVRTAILRHGDTLELAKAVRFNVVVETGEVRSSGTYRALPAVKEGEPRFSGDWKTRYEWESGEMAAFAAAAAGVRPDEGERQTADGTLLKKPTPKPAAAATPAAKPAAPAAAAKSAAPAAKPAAPAAAAKPAAAAPAAPAPPAVPPPVVPPPAAVATPSGAAAIPTRAATSKPSLQEVAAARSAAPAAPAPPAPPPPAPPKPPPAAAADEDAISATVTDMPAAAAPAATGPIAVARFTADKFAFVVERPGRYEVGRATGTAVRVDHTTVSRRHAAITLGEDRRTLVAEDLGAANGTRLNGREIKGAQALVDGDVLQLGEVSFKVALERS